MCGLEETTVSIHVNLILFRLSLSHFANTLYRWFLGSLVVRFKFVSRRYTLVAHVLTIRLGLLFLVAAEHLEISLVYTKDSNLLIIFLLSVNKLINQKL